MSSQVLREDSSDFPGRYQLEILNTWLPKARNSSFPESSPLHPLLLEYEGIEQTMSIKFGLEFDEVPTYRFFFISGFLLFCICIRVYICLHTFQVTVETINGILKTKSIHRFRDLNWFNFKQIERTQIIHYRDICIWSLFMKCYISWK